MSKKYRRDYYWINKKKENERSKSWYQRNKRDKIKKARIWLDMNNFGGKRVEVLKRDRVCRICGSKNNLVVHHIDGTGQGKIGKGKKTNNKIDNLIVLCKSCYTKIYETKRSAKIYSNYLK